MATKPENVRPNRKKRPKQGYLGDMAPPSIPEIDSAALVYAEARDARMQLTEEETTAKGRLLELMKQHKLKTYDFEDYNVFLVDGEPNVKVKKKKAAKVESNGEAEE